MGSSGDIKECPRVFAGKYTFFDAYGNRKPPATKAAGGFNTLL
ncbi:hypothetical protein DCCM_3628 [Desulfocucumis palustris]|uniref:Uncharacterized protein n=1 Tax=Desulfocucumis palustris TaxID=1898651 RepID=A0A2L2XEC1_9FIRM|nr:hypothetical protein DCCM_3628 [Desulfocucumis palustris]